MINARQSGSVFDYNICFFAYLVFLFDINPFVLGHAACLGDQEGDELTLLWKTHFEVFDTNLLSYSLFKLIIALIIVQAEIAKDKLFKNSFVIL